MVLPVPLDAITEEAIHAPAEEIVGPVSRRRRRRWPWFSGTILALFIFAGLFAPYITPYPPNEIDLAASLQPPVGFGGTWSHAMGTDDLGRDILAA